MGRYLKRNHGCEQPSQVICVDVDAEQERNQNGTINRSSRFLTTRIYAKVDRRNSKGWYGAKEQEFTCGKVFWAWVRDRCQKRRPLTVYGWNWHFLTQATELWREIDAEHFALTIPERRITNEQGQTEVIKEWQGFVAIDDKPFIIYLVSKKGTVKIIDAKNYFDCKMSDLQSSFVGPQNAGSPENRLQDDETLAGRTRVSCVRAAMLQTMTAWTDGNRGNWQPTAAMLAMSNYRHEFLPPEGLCIPGPEHDRKFEREGFFGGEFRNFYRGWYRGKCHKYDVNGLYPSVMAQGLFPRAVRKEAKLGTPQAATLPSDGTDCMARVLVHGCSLCPTRNDKRGTDYPNELCATVLCGAELARAVHDRRIKEVYNWIQYDLAPLFDRYVAYWWSVRKQAKAMGNVAQAGLAKLMLVSLYAKFAGRKPQWKVTKEIEPLKRWGQFFVGGGKNGGFQRCRAIGGLTQVNIGFEESDRSFIAISAFVTSAARERIRKDRERLGDRAVLVQQADAFVVTPMGRKHLEWDGMIGDELGQYRHVEDYNWVWVHGPNEYEHDKGFCIAGLPALSERRGRTNHWRTWVHPKGINAANLDMSPGVRVTEKEFVLNVRKSIYQYDSEGWQYA